MGSTTLVSKSYSAKKPVPQKTAQQNKNDEYIQKLTNDAVANSRYKTQKAESTFKKIYGRTAQFIDLNNISSVANTINKLLLSNTIKSS